jgi:integral membrane sensor domain MASE1
MKNTSQVLILACCLMIAAAFISLASANPVGPDQNRAEALLILAIIVPVLAAVGIIVLYIIHRRQIKTEKTA